MASQRYQRTQNMATRTIAGQTILIPVARRPENFDAVFILNDSSSTLWQHLTEPREAGELARLLGETFAVEGRDTEIAADVATFLGEMLAFGAIDAVHG